MPIRLCEPCETVCCQTCDVLLELAELDDELELELEVDFETGTSAETDPRETKTLELTPAGTVVVSVVIFVLAGFDVLIPLR